MGRSLQLLIGVTCLVVIAVSGFWTWKALSDEAARKESERMRANLAECNRVSNALDGELQSELTFGEVAYCVKLDLVSEAKLKTLAPETLQKVMDLVDGPLFD